MVSQWKDWRWQVKNSIKDIENFESLLNIKFEPEKKKELQHTVKKFPLSITPYYLSLINTKDYENDPIFKQSFPSPLELNISENDMNDPLAEDKDSPVPGIIHRYPDRILFHISNICSMYCRHCTRKRKVGDRDFIPGKKEITRGLTYINETPAIRDVLLSGGDPFMLQDSYLDWILTELQKIKHVEVIRIGTRMPVVLPYRIDDDLVKMLKKHHPLWVNTHFNHPKEITPSSKEAVGKLADAGIPLGNQSVLLAGINDSPEIMKNLVHRLVENRVRPYYLYQCDLSRGLSHFRTPVRKGMEIIKSLIGHTSGFAVPTYVIDAPGGGGKIPVVPNYLVSLSKDEIVLKNYEGGVTTYKEPGEKIDVIEKLNGSVIQHGKLNDRIYLMKLSLNDLPEIIEKMNGLAEREDYSKIFAKVPGSAKGEFEKDGYMVEARVPGFFNGKEDAYFMSKFLWEQRLHTPGREDRDRVTATAQRKPLSQTMKKIPEGYRYMALDKSAVPEMTKIYEQVFQTYPFPIRSESYLRKTMDEDIIYFAIRNENKIVALSSAEIDLDSKNVEMSDFATVPGERNKGLATFLLQKMEEKVREIGIETTYSIARASSPGINTVFIKMGYRYGGLLVNNTNIAGRLEDMNVWYKRFSE